MGRSTLQTTAGLVRLHLHVCGLKCGSASLETPDLMLEHGNQAAASGQSRSRGLASSRLAGRHSVNGKESGDCELFCSPEARHLCRATSVPARLCWQDQVAYWQVALALMGQS